MTARLASSALLLLAGAGATAFCARMAMRVRASYTQDCELLRLGNNGQGLQVVSRERDAGIKEKRVEVVFIHGMWHGAWFFKPLQDLLAREGFASHAIEHQTFGDCSRATFAVALATTLLKHCRKDKRVVVVGHSQGSILTQTLLESDRSQALSGVNVVGAVLLGAIPLGMLPPPPPIFADNMFFGRRGLGMLTGYPYFMVTGRLISAAAGGRIFLNNSSQTTPFGAREEYEQRVFDTGPDGRATMTHFLPAGWVPRFNTSLKVVVLGGQNDIIYPPRKLAAAFHARFPDAQHVVAEGQDHCFCEPGWEQTMGKPLLHFLEDCSR